MSIGWFKLAALAGPLVLALAGGCLAISAGIDASRLRRCGKLLIIGALTMLGLIAADLVVGHNSAIAYFTYFSEQHLQPAELSSANRPADPALVPNPDQSDLTRSE